VAGHAVAVAANAIRASAPAPGRRRVVRASSVGAPRREHQADRRELVLAERQTYLMLDPARQSDCALG
jgi:hypothetical protein